ncbi:MAG: hypothetical protein H6713_34195 [Myxococcales bacterium]|nr:hypothetical protein [Myxococcales bacterium]MCB9755016.1 hypothetical protein [Myxococcales bacterium]
MSWGQSITLSVEPQPGRAQAWRAFWDVWERLRRGMSANLRRKPCRRVLSYGELQAQEHWSLYDRRYISGQAERGRFMYFFDDEQGNANVYCEVMAHWTHLTFFLLYDEVEAIFARRGYTLRTPRPELDALVRAPVDAPLVVAQQYVNQVVADAGSPRGWRLAVDLSGPKEGQLTAKERAHADAVFASRLCACDYCEKLRRGELAPRRAGA